ncbi:kinase-like domain-containing protein [Lyophyllum atratum]|nr:kinase-like domain-containing protein [Lyophyllum atratum]
MSATAHQSSLLWESGVLSPVPVWTREPGIPVIEAIARRHLCPDTSEEAACVSITATFLAQGAFNKLYTITVDYGSSNNKKDYVFRVTLPVEPFYKTASEVATLSYIKNHTSIPVPSVIAHSTTADNELGFEWILLEKVTGVDLRDVWPALPLPAKETMTKVVAGFVRQMWDLGGFDAVGNIYSRGALGEAEPAAKLDEEFVIGPVVNPFCFKGARRLKVERNRGPYRTDQEYLLALINMELADMRALQALDPGEDSAEYDEDLAEDAPEIERIMQELQSLLPSLFPPSHRSSSGPAKEAPGFVLCHHDLSLSNIMMDPDTQTITGIVDWECVGIMPRWQEPYPQFLQGPASEEKPEPLEEGDTDECRLENWENWEKTQLRKVFDEIVGPHEGEDLKQEFRRQLDMVEFSTKMVDRWIAGVRERLKGGQESTGNV